MSAPRPELANVWFQAACASLAGSRATTFEERAELVVKSAAEDADEMLQHFLSRFPHEAPPGTEGDSR